MRRLGLVIVTIAGLLGLAAAGMWVYQRQQTEQRLARQAALLELPLVWEADVKRIVLDLRGAGELDVVGLNPPERTPKKGHVLVRKNVQGAEDR